MIVWAPNRIERVRARNNMLRGPNLKWPAPMHAPPPPARARCAIPLFPHCSSVHRASRLRWFDLALLIQLFQFRGGNRFLRPAVTSSWALIVAATIGIKIQEPCNTDIQQIIHKKMGTAHWQKRMNPLWARTPRCLAWHPPSSCPSHRSLAHHRNAFI